eukprot:10117386-Heterocapsa_arctica.AAC.1
MQRCTMRAAACSTAAPPPSTATRTTYITRYMLPELQAEKERIWKVLQKCSNCVPTVVQK